MFSESKVLQKCFYDEVTPIWMDRARQALTRWHSLFSLSRLAKNVSTGHTFKTYHGFLEHSTYAF